MVRDSINTEAIFHRRIHVAEVDCMQMLKKPLGQYRFSHSNPNTTAMRNKISMAQMENKHYRGATA